MKFEFTETKKHVVIQEPINEKNYDVENPYGLGFTTNVISSEEQRYTAALNGSINANLKPAEEKASSYSLISWVKPASSSSDATLTITTGAKAQNWKLNFILDGQWISSEKDEFLYCGINADSNDLNLGSDIDSVLGNRGMAFTANLSVSVSDKGGIRGEEVAVSTAGIYSDSNINVNGTMKGSVNVKNVQTYAISTGYGFQADVLTFSKDITGKITVTSDSKFIGALAVAMQAYFIIDIAGDIKNAISVTANTSKGILAKAQIFYVYAITDYIHIGAVNAKLTATAKNTNPDARNEDKGQPGALATVMESGKDIVINGAVTKDVTATATSKTLAVAQTFKSGSSLIFNSEVAGKITASASGGFINIESKEDFSMPITAQAIYAMDKLLFRANVTKDITATAKGEMFAIAGAIFAEMSDDATDANIKFLGAVKGKISANASVKKGIVYSVAVNSTCDIGDNTIDGVLTQSGMIVFEKGIGNAISATASGSQEALLKMVPENVQTAYYTAMNSKDPTEVAAAKAFLDAHLQESLYMQYSQKPVEASAFCSDNDITVHDINGAITASATTKGGAAVAFAFQLNKVECRASVFGKEDFTSRSAVLNIDNVNKNITVTAKSSGDNSEAFAAAVARPVKIKNGNLDLSDSPDFVLNGSIKGKITVTATAKGQTFASGIYAEKGTFGSGSFSLGTINVTANGNEASRAVGLRFAKLEMDKYAAGSGTITGNLSVTCKNGAAEGIIMESISVATFTSKTLAMNVKVTGKEACAIQLGKDAGDLDPWFMSATALSGTVSAVTTDKKNGKAFAIKGGDATSDYVNILGGAKITGDIDLGAQDDQLYIHAGANVKGNISNVEEVWFVLDDASTAKNAMWQGDFDEDFLSNVNAKLGISAYYGEEGTFTLFQSVNTTADEFMSFAGNIVLKIDGVEKNFEGISCAFEDYDYTLGFKNGKKGGTVTLNITKSSKD